VDTTSPSLNPAAELRDIRLTYGAGAGVIEAIKGISLKAYAAEVLMLMGPSGSGKSSLLQIMGCLRKPTSGRVLIGDAYADRMQENELSAFRAEKIGFVFQHYNLLPSLNAWENVALALELRGFPQEVLESESRQMLGRLGLEDRMDAFPDELSGGQKQRVAVARALVGKPELILVDEPTAALDAKSGSDVARMLSEIAHENGHAVVIVTHDARISGIADRILHIEDGKISEERKNIRVQTKMLREYGRYEYGNSEYGHEEKENSDHGDDCRLDDRRLVHHL
jgi:putative ABC transport system ATP-binding protein